MLGEATKDFDLPVQIFSQRDSELRTILSANFSLGEMLPVCSTEQARSRRRRRQAAFSQVSSHAIESGAGLLIIAGDLFAQYDPKPDDLCLVVRELGRLHKSDITVLAIPGDRDSAPEEERSALDLLQDLGLLKQLSDSSPLCIQIGKLGLQISSLLRSYGESSQGSLQRLHYETQANLHLLVSHHLVEGMGVELGCEDVVNLDSVRALLGVHVLVAGGGSRPMHGRVGGTAVAVPGDPGLPDGTGGFLEIDVSRRGLERIDVIPGLGTVRRIVDIPASMLAAEDARTLICGQLEPLLEPEAEILLQITGRTSPKTLRTAGLAGISRWAKTCVSDFQLDLTGLRIVSETVSGPGHLSTMDEMSRLVSEINSSDPLETEASEMAIATLRRIRGDSSDTGLSE